MLEQGIYQQVMGRKPNCKMKQDLITEVLAFQLQPASL